MKRVFVGIELPQDIKFSIYSYLGSLPRPVRGWERKNDLHLTLLFIGETTEEELVEIENCLKQIKFKAFELRIKGIEFFSRRIMYLEVEQSDEIVELKEQVLKVLSGKHPKQEKKFIPHITIKRWQRYEFDFLKSMSDKNPFYPLKFKVSTLSLFESRKNSEGDKYHVIGRFPTDMFDYSCIELKKE